MTDPIFHDLSLTALRDLAAALLSGALAPPYNRHEVEKRVPKDVAGAVSLWLRALEDDGMAARHIVRVLRSIAAEREAAQHRADGVELVWTGPETAATASRDTKVVVQELFRQAKRSVLVATYALDRGEKAAAPFRALAKRMDEDPDLRVRLFVNIQRPHGDEQPESVLLREFADRFRNEIWPGKRLPEVFFDPRALVPGPGPKACLHAKCVVIDDEVAFVTSANFTEAAHERNAEAGVLVRDRGVAGALVRQFEVRGGAAGGFRRVPGLTNGGAARPVG